MNQVREREGVIWGLQEGLTKRDHSGRGRFCFPRRNLCLNEGEVGFWFLMPRMIRVIVFMGVRRDNVVWQLTRVELCVHVAGGLLQHNNIVAGDGVS